MTNPKFKLPKLSRTGFSGAVFFDLDGTIADSIGVMWQVFLQFHKSLWYDALFEDFERYNGIPLPELIVDLHHRLGVNATIAELTKDYQKRVDDIYLGVPPMKNANLLLKALREKGFFLALVTSNSNKRTRAWLELNNLLGMFDHLVCAEDIIYSKPAPEPYLNALAAYGSTPGNVYVVEDAPLGAKSGLAAGLRTIVIAEQKSRPLFPKGVVFVSELQDLFGEFNLA